MIGFIGFSQFDCARLELHCIFKITEFGICGGQSLIIVTMIFVQFQPLGVIQRFRAIAVFLDGASRIYFYDSTDGMQRYELPAAWRGGNS